MKNERSESMTTKQMLYKNNRSAAPLHKKKSLYGPQGVVRSSGYGKSTSHSKQSFPATERKTPRETFKKNTVKARSPSDRAKSKGNSVLRGLNFTFKIQSTLLFMLHILFLP